MHPINARGILLDIEGTTSSILFVYEKMFPYVREHLSDFLAANWESPAVQSCLPLLREDLGEASDWLDGKPRAQQLQLVCQGVLQMMDDDRKATGLKHLQGLIWKDGFHSGQLVAHVYDDVPEAIRRWDTDGHDVRIYSSGSVAAQKLFFGHTIAGDLLPHFSGHYDTTVGGKRDVDSYRKIAAEFSLPPESILFVSDVIEELEAARAAGLETLLSVRPGNHPVLDDHDFDSISSFEEIQLV